MKTEEWKRMLANMSDDVKALNPDIGTTPKREGGASPPPQSRITETIVDMLHDIAPDLTIVTEHRFHKRRKWRFDFANVESMVAIEYNGGVWMSGRHNRGKGYLDDLEKLNAAQAMGWIVFQLGTGMVSSDALASIVETMRKRIHEATIHSTTDGLDSADGPQAGQE
jgi:hypothetical protein